MNVRPIHVAPFGIPLDRHRASWTCPCRPTQLRELIGNAPVFLHRGEQPELVPPRRTNVDGGMPLPSERLAADWRLVGAGNAETRR